jgi:biopolymer transport protein TolR
MGIEVGDGAPGRGLGGGTRRGRRRALVSQINVTPFVDVMLVLLVVFMVTAPLLTAGVAVDLPSARAPALTTPDAAPLEITLRADGAVFMGESRVERARLAATAAAIARTTPDRQVYLRADAGLPYGAIMDVLGELNAAGLTKVALVSAPQGT